jgi:MoxR-like ATPase
MNGDVESRMMALIDSVASSSWQHPDTGEVVKPHKDFSVIATMNGEPEDLAPAILDRLVVRVAVNEPHPAALESLPDYLRGVATKWTNPDMGPERKSLRAFVDFERMYRASNNLELSAQVVFPDSWKQMADVMLVDKTTAGS